MELSWKDSIPRRRNTRVFRIMFTNQGLGRNMLELSYATIRNSIRKHLIYENRVDVLVKNHYSTLFVYKNL